MRRVTIAAVALTMLAAGAWTGVYLYRWEWSRALWTTMLFVAAEVALATLVVLRRLGQVTDTLAANRESRPDPARAHAARVQSRLAESRPEVHRFAWLDDMVQRTNVFVTLVVGGGLLVSGLLWMFDKVAAKTLTPVGERQLATRLTRLSFPEDGLVPDDSLLFAAELGQDERADLAFLLMGHAERRSVIR